MQQYEIKIQAWPDVQIMNAEIMLEDLVSRIPDIKNIYEHIYGKSSNSFEARYWGCEYHLIKSQYASEEIMRSLFNLDSNIQIDGSGPTMGFPRYDFYRVRLGTPQYEPASSDLPPLEGTMSEFSSVVRKFDNGMVMSPLLKCFALSYALGMLVRYFPSEWTALWRNEKGAKHFPVLRASIEYVENFFPLLALETIEMRRTTNAIRSPI